jgi:molecular chaperone IbpA
MEMSTAFDFSPLYRSMIGVDRMVDLAEAALRGGEDSGYPPYDVEKTGEESYRITLAAAGFGPADLEVVAQANLLVIRGKKADGGSARSRSFLHQGLAKRAFERRFELADHVVVISAHHADGLLSIDLVRETPEALKPRRIEIATERLERSEQPKALGSRNAA